MALTRTAWTDDDGSGTTGTIINNAEKTALYDQIDARWSELTVTTTGSTNNMSITSGGVEADVLLFTNASDLTITGIAAPASPAKAGKELVLISLGAGHVFLSHLSGSSSVGNKFNNFYSSAPTPLAAGYGKAVYRYSVVNGLWLLVAHEQGAWITPTFAAGNYTSAGTWTVASGDVATQAYFIRGRMLTVTFRILTTTVSGTPSTLLIGNGAYGGFTATKTILNMGMASNNGGANEVTFNSVVAAGTNIQVSQLDGGTWTNATDTTAVYGEIAFEVT